MFAVIETGGAQLKVSPNQIVEINKIAGEVGEKVTFDRVLTVGGDSIKLGEPLVKGATVTAEIIAQKRGEKVIVFKKKRRHNYRRKNGHRQYLTALRITAINA
jgi:large subunit ribosomal protein L21